MGVEVIHHHNDPLGLRVARVDQLLDFWCAQSILVRLLGYVHPAPTRKRLHEHEHVGYPATLVLVVSTLDSSPVPSAGLPSVS